MAREAMEEVGLTVRPLRKVWENLSSPGTFRLHWWLAEYVAGELVPDKREVSAARWLTVGEICGLNGAFEGNREFYQTVLPALARGKWRRPLSK